MTSLKREKSDEPDFFNKKIHTYVDFEKSLHKTLRELVEAISQWLH